MEQTNNDTTGCLSVTQAKEVSLVCTQTVVFFGKRKMSDFWASYHGSLLKLVTQSVPNVQSQFAARGRNSFWAFAEKSHGAGDEFLCGFFILLCFHALSTESLVSKSDACWTGRQFSATRLRITRQLFFPVSPWSSNVTWPNIWEKKTNTGSIVTNKIDTCCIFNRLLIILSSNVPIKTKQHRTGRMSHKRESGHSSTSLRSLTAALVGMS